MQNVIQIFAGTCWALFIYAFILLIGVVANRHVKGWVGNYPTILTGVLALFLCILAATYLSLYSKSVSILFRYSLLPVLCGVFYWGWKNHEFLRKYKQEFLENSIVIALAALFSYGFQFYPYDGFSFERPANNFMIGLPIDYKISLMFSESLVQGQPLTFGDWLGSDRPPLFSGAVLFFSVPFVELKDTYLYAGVGTQLILVPVVIKIINELLGKTLKLSDKLIIAFCLVSTPLFFHNLFFLWPKIFSATFLLVAIYSLFLSEHRKTFEQRIFASCALALSYLSHGGTAFAFPAIALVYLFQNHSLRDLRHGFSMFVGFVSINLPWIFYQKVVQPPGDRLLKWHLLGQIEIVPYGVREVFIEKYRDFTLNDFGERLYSSLSRQVNVLDFQNYGLRGAKAFVESSFFELSLSVGLFSLLLLPIFFVRDKIIRILNVIILLICLFWFLMPFEGAKSMHEGPYALPVLILLNVILAAFYIYGKSSFKYKKAALVTVLIVPGLMSLSLFEFHRRELIAAHSLTDRDVYTLTTYTGDLIGKDFQGTQVDGFKVIGSYISSDTDTTVIRMTARQGRYIYYKTGPSALGQSLRIEQGGEVLHEISETMFENWTRIDVGKHGQIEIILTDNGRNWGEWSAIAGTE